MGKKKSAHVSDATPALKILRESGVSYDVLEYEHSATMEHGYALDTVSILGLDPGVVFKTLLVEVDGMPAVGVVPASGRLNLKAIAKAVGGKSAVMMDPSKAEKLTGYVTGGISPLGQRHRYRTVIDESAQALEHMCISGGKRTLSVLVSPANLVELCAGSFAPIGT